MKRRYFAALVAGALLSGPAFGQLLGIQGTGTVSGSLGGSLGAMPGGTQFGSSLGSTVQGSMNGPGGVQTNARANASARGTANASAEGNGPVFRQPEPDLNNPVSMPLSAPLSQPLDSGISRPLNRPDALRGNLDSLPRPARQTLAQTTEPLQAQKASLTDKAGEQADKLEKPAAVLNKAVDKTEERTKHPEHTAKEVKREAEKKLNLKTASAARTIDQKSPKANAEAKPEAGASQSAEAGASNKKASARSGAHARSSQTAGLR